MKRKYRVMSMMCGMLYTIILLSAWGVLENGKIEMVRWTSYKESLCTDGEAEKEETAEQGTRVKEIGEPPQIALTFDDGPNPKSTPLLLDGLRERGVKVTFFVIGASAEKYPEIVRREDAEGHIVGNHTYNHVEITRLTEEAAKKEIGDTSEVIRSITGKPAGFMRPPFGAWQKKLELGMEVMPVLWTVDPLDWTTENEEEIVNKVVTEVKENDIILLHDCYVSSVRAALRIIDILQKEGYEFVTVEELLLN